MCEKVTLYPLFAFLPVSWHCLPDAAAGGSPGVSIAQLINVQRSFLVSLDTLHLQKRSGSGSFVGCKAVGKPISRSSKKRRRWQAVKLWQLTSVNSQHLLCLILQCTFATDWSHLDHDNLCCALFLRRSIASYTSPPKSTQSSRAATFTKSAVFN